jgi:hypothetical protein
MQLKEAIRGVAAHSGYGLLIRCNIEGGSVERSIDLGKERYATIIFSILIGGWEFKLPPTKKMA